MNYDNILIIIIFRYGKLITSIEIPLDRAFFPHNYGDYRNPHIHTILGIFIPNLSKPTYLG